MARRRFTEREVIQTLMGQGVEIACFRCCLPFEPKDIPGVEREHLHEFELGGPDVPANCAYSHHACHSAVTNGSKATTAGSSKHRIAKARRIAAGGKRRKGPKMKSKPFPKFLGGFRITRRAKA